MPKPEKQEENRHGAMNVNRSIPNKARLDMERVLEKQDFEMFDESILSQEVPLPALMATNLLLSWKDPSLGYVATLETFHCSQNGSHLPGAVVEEERKKRGFNSQLVLQQIRLTKDKDLVVQLKNTHRFDMWQRWYTGQYPDEIALKESAQGTSLVFLTENKSLVFDALTLQLTHNLKMHVFDILGNTVFLNDGEDFLMKKLSRL